MLLSRVFCCGGPQAHEDKSEQVTQATETTTDHHRRVFKTKDRKKSKTPTPSKDVTFYYRKHLVVQAIDCCSEIASVVITRPKLKTAHLKKDYD